LQNNLISGLHIFGFSLNNNITLDPGGPGIDHALTPEQFKADIGKTSVVEGICITGRKQFIRMERRS